MNIKISKQWRDIIQKHTSALFRNVNLEYYGVKTAKIKEMINVELPVVEVAEKSTDFIFLLEDDTYLHFEFQSAYNKDDLIRFALYDLRLYQRDKRKIQTVVIYSSDVNTAEANLDIGSVAFTSMNIMMSEYDGNIIFADLEKKLKEKQDLSDIDMLNLIFLPLMQNDLPKRELAEKSIELAQTISDKNKRDTCIASVFAFSQKYLNNNDIQQILEVLKMTDIATMLIEDTMIDIAKKAIKENLTLELISKLTGLDIETIKELQEQQENDENEE